MPIRELDAVLFFTTCLGIYDGMSKLHRANPWLAVPEQEAALRSPVQCSVNRLELLSKLAIQLLTIIDVKCSYKMGEDSLRSTPWHRETSMSACITCSQCFTEELCLCSGLFQCKLCCEQRLLVTLYHLTVPNPKSRWYGYIL